MVTDCSINCKALFPMQASSLHRAPQAEGSSGAALRAGHRGTHFYSQHAIRRQKSQAPA